jgi:hypothetical protein
MLGFTLYSADYPKKAIVSLCILINEVFPPELIGQYQLRIHRKTVSGLSLCQKILVILSTFYRKRSSNIIDIINEVSVKMISLTFISAKQ